MERLGLVEFECVHCFQKHKIVRVKKEFSENSVAANKQFCEVLVEFGYLKEVYDGRFIQKGICPNCMLNYFSESDLKPADNGNVFQNSLLSALAIPYPKN